MGGFDKAFFREAWGLIRPYWVSEERRIALGLLAVVVALDLGLVFINVQINLWSNDFYNTLQNLDKAAFLDQLLKFCWLAAAYIAIAVYQLYFNQMLLIRWRRWLTERYVESWLADRSFYRLQLLDKGTDNPDQRIAEDLQLFVEKTSSLSLGLLNATVTLLSFLAILWTLSGTLDLPLGETTLSIPGYMVWVAVAYALGGTYVAHKIGKPLITLNFNQQRYEADFRFSLVRLRENAEAVALYGGEGREARGFARRFANVVDNFRKIMERQKGVTGFTATYQQIAIVFPILVASPRFFAGEIQLGGLIQTASAFGQVQSSLSYIVNVYPTLAVWRATVERLISFSRRLAELRERGEGERVAVAETGAGAVRAKGLSVTRPAGDMLVKGLDLTVEAGDTLLVMGPTGSGKSTLFRAIAGLWPFGAGAIERPSGTGLMIVPQRPYIPLGTLREALLYPREAKDIDEAALKTALGAVGLARLSGELDAGENWGLTLSVGEQQRLALARVLLHKPDWILLDEATSALDEPTEARLFGLLRERLPKAAIVSIGHRGTLKALHRRRLELDGKGGYAYAQ
ncbi:MAG: ABC transporter ATP-binding protein/permease [Alphaproteobacteria bacterium]|nr:ABC transporter ATP-binding protein/permease [Alphaproteobacteria bacterium]